MEKQATPIQNNKIIPCKRTFEIGCWFPLCKCDDTFSPGVEKNKPVIDIAGYNIITTLS